MFSMATIGTNCLILRLRVFWKTGTEDSSTVARMHARTICRDLLGIPLSAHHPSVLVDLVALINVNMTLSQLGNSSPSADLYSQFV